MEKTKTKHDLRSYINDEACDSRYYAELYHKEIRPCEVVTYDDWSEDALFPIDLKDTQFQWSEIYLEYFVEGLTETDLETKVSNLISAHTKCQLRFEDLRFSYNCKLAEKPELEYIAKLHRKVMILLKSDYKYTDEIVKLLKTNGEELYQRGNIKTPLIVKLVPTALIPLLELKINDNIIKLQNLKAEDEILVDGRDFIVSVNGVLDFEVVNDLWEFPILLPGNNTISFNSENVKMSVQYTPRFV